MQKRYSDPDPGPDPDPDPNFQMLNAPFMVDRFNSKSTGSVDEMILGSNCAGGMSFFQSTIDGGEGLCTCALKRTPFLIVRCIDAKLRMNLRLMAMEFPYNNI